MIALAYNVILHTNLDFNRLPSQAVDAIANDVVTFSPRNQLFIDKMIYEGKKLILQDALLTDTPDEYKVGYTQNKFSGVLRTKVNLELFCGTKLCIQFRCFFG